MYLAKICDSGETYITELEDEEVMFIGDRANAPWCPIPRRPRAWRFGLHPDGRMMPGGWCAIGHTAQEALQSAQAGYVVRRAA